MRDAASEPVLKQPRAIGEIAVSARLRDGASRLGRLRQAGCAKALTPRHPGDDCLAVTINTAGGLTGGDRLSITGAALAGAR
ncbi:MAG: urease accessory protein UreD, partial [Pseudomonadota bacterium]